MKPAKVGVTNKHLRLLMLVATPTKQ